MNLKCFVLSIVAGAFLISINAQETITVEAANTDISENLDLEAVASVFAEAEDLEDFEKKLNDPETQISNLDLNEDGEVDYLRVVENSKDETHLVTIQAVIGEDQFQDVATIDVEKDSEGETHVQVVGDVYMYGDNYIIEPVYVHPPVIVVWFWGPYYRPWRSPYYWGHYPPYYRPWHPYPPHRYRTNVRVHVNVNHTYRHPSVRRSKTSIELQRNTRRNDYGSRNPDQSFTRRNEGAKNKEELRSRNTGSTEVKRNNASPKKTENVKSNAARSSGSGTATKKQQSNPSTKSKTKTRTRTKSKTSGKRRR